jgi:glutamate/aspartate transport system substrate-binding protein
MGAGDVETRVRALVDGTIDLECGSTTNTLSRQERVDFSLTTFITGASLLLSPDRTWATSSARSGSR